MRREIRVCDECKKEMDETQIDLKINQHNLKYRDSSTMLLDKEVCSRLCAYKVLTEFVCDKNTCSKGA